MNGRTNTTSVTEVIEGVQIPLESVTNFSLVPDTGKIALTWTDPVDKVATPGGEMVAEWNYTLIIRREDRAPVSPSDGIQVLREGTRNQYSSTPYIDEGLDIGKTYYYAAYAYSTIGVVSEATLANASPREAILKYKTTKNLSSNDFDGNEWGEYDSSDAAFASTASHVLITGGEYASVLKDTVYCFTKDLVKSVASSLSVAKYYAAGGSINGYAVIAGGTDNPYLGWTATGTVDMFSPELTKTSTTYSGLAAIKARSATVQNNLLFAGGEINDNNSPTNSVSVIDSSLTISSASALSTAARGHAGTTNGTHAIFAGGTQYSVYPNDPFGRDVYDAYDSSLTRTSGNLPDGASNGFNNEMGGCYLNTRAVFAGGVQEYENDVYYSKTCFSIDQSLTTQVLSDLPYYKKNLAAENIGGFALFAGGLQANAPSATSTAGSKTVDVYNASFTRSSATNLPGALGKNSISRSGVIDNVAMFFSLPKGSYDLSTGWFGIASYVVE